MRSLDHCSCFELLSEAVVEEPVAAEGLVELASISQGHLPGNSKKYSTWRLQKNRTERKRERERDNKCVYICIYIYVYEHIYMHICMCIYIYIFEFMNG